MRTKLSIHAYDDGLNIRRDFDDSPTDHDWVEYADALPRTMEGWIDLAINLLEVTEDEANEASIHVSFVEWSGKDGITFSWRN